MRATMRRTTLITFVILLAGKAVALAQPRCDSGFIGLQEAMTLQLSGKALIVASAETPLAVAPATQLEAPASTDAGGSIVSLPGLPSLLGLAYENGLVKSEDGIATVSLTPFSFLALARPAYTSDQLLYVSPLARQLRRFGGTLAFGGKGDSFDRDGDGTLDEALEATKLDDIVTWEAKVQFGSRDRRDPKNFREFDEKLDAAGVFDTSQAEFVELVAALDEPTRSLPQSPPNSGCFDPQRLAAIFQQEKIAVRFEKLKLADQEYEGAANEVFDRIDRRPILSLVYGGTEREEGFGPDKLFVALRGAFTYGGTNAIELSWSEVENLLGIEDAITWKLGWQNTRLFLKGSSLAKDGISLALGGSYEMFDDVPQATHDTIGKLNAKFSVPLGEGVSIPISITWANHSDLLTDEKEVRGHIGFTVDLSKIQEQLSAKKEKGSG